MNFKAIIAAIAAVTTVSFPCHAEKATDVIKHTETLGYNWYCKNNDSGDVPILPSEFSFIEDCEGYYVDKKANESNKVIYLTFDAGYENGNIEKILDVLKSHNAKGAFFVLGNLIKRNTDTVKRMVDEGHLVCNHTNLHHDMTKTTNFEKFKAELDSLNDIMKEYCGCELAPFYRPPEGRFSEKNLRAAVDCGYKTVFWSYAYADWDNNRQPDANKAYSKIISHTHNGEVILLHPTSSTNAEIMDRLLTEWESMGYRFGTLYELCEKA